MTKYQIEKEKARQEAIDWQRNFEEHNLSYYELWMQQIRFEKLARQFGLRKELQQFHHVLIFLQFLKIK